MMCTTRFALLVICLAELPSVALADDAMIAKLKSGGIITVSVPIAGSPVQAGRAMGLIDAPANLVQEILAGLAEYKSFVPRIITSRRVKDNRFVIEIDLPWPVNKTWAYVQVTKGVRQNVHVVTWKMLNGTLKSYEGVAWIQPWTAGRSMVIYQMLAVPKTATPNGLMNEGMRDAATTMVEVLRTRAAKMARAGVKVASDTGAPQVN